MKTLIIASILLAIGISGIAYKICSRKKKTQSATGEQSYEAVVNPSEGSEKFP